MTDNNNNNNTCSAYSFTFWEEERLFVYKSAHCVVRVHAAEKRERCARRMAISALCPVQNISSLVFLRVQKKAREKRKRGGGGRRRHTHKKKRALIFEKEKSSRGANLGGGSCFSFFVRGATLGPIFHFLFFSSFFWRESSRFSSFSRSSKPPF